MVMGSTTGTVWRADLPRRFPESIPEFLADRRPVCAVSSPSRSAEVAAASDPSGVVGSGGRDSNQMGKSKAVPQNYGRRDENLGYRPHVFYLMDSKGFVWRPQRDSNPRFPPFPVKPCRIKKLAKTNVSPKEGAENLRPESCMADW